MVVVVIVGKKAGWRGVGVAEEDWRYYRLELRRHRTRRGSRFE